MATEPEATPGRRIPGPVTLGVFGGLVLASLVVGLGPSTAILAFAGLCAIAGALLSAEFGVALIVFLVALFQRQALFTISLPLWGGGLKPTDLVLFATLLGWALRMVLQRKTVARLPHRAMAFVGMFLAWAVVCASLGRMHGFPNNQSLLELRPLLLYALFFPIVSEFTLASVRRLVWVIKIAAVVVGLQAIALYVMGKGEEATYAEGAQRISVGWVALILALVLTVGFRFVKGRERMLSAAVAIVSLIGLAVTFQRAAFVGSAVAVATVVWLSQKRERTRVLAVIAGLLVIGAGILAFIGTWAPTGVNILGALRSRLGSIAEFEDDVSAQHRAAEWSAAWAMIAVHPIAGNGLGARVEFYSPGYDPERKRMGGWSENFYIHNSYVWLLTKTGIIGLALFAGMMGVGLAKARAAVDRSSTPAERHLRIGLFAGWIALLTVSIFGPMVTTDDTVPFMVSILGAAFVQPDRRDGRAGRPL